MKSSKYQSTLFFGIKTSTNANTDFFLYIFFLIKQFIFTGKNTGVFFSFNKNVILSHKMVLFLYENTNVFFSLNKEK